MTLKGTRRTDWANYIDPKDQERARQERWYKISRAVEACVQGNGQMDLIIADGNRHTVTTLSRPARQKLALLLKRGR